MILADSSVWIEYFRATGSTTDLRLTELINDDGPLTVTEPVILELVIGARDEADEQRLRTALDHFELIRFDSLTDFNLAARIYHDCRRIGFTPRGLIDCLIAAVAWRAGAALLTNDRDLIRIAGVIGVALDPASITA